jgi:transcriptional regulator with XRE-family HTH domain
MIFCIAYYLIGMNTNGNFGKMLAELRRVKGFTQVELAKSIGVSQRMIAYYERHAKRPPLEKLHSIAKVLSISADELLGIKPVKKQPGAPKDAYLHRKLQQVTQLTKDNQKVIVTMIDALASKKGNG